MSDKPIMGCGHAANATDRDGNPSCCICAGLDPGALVVVATPSLEARKARCGHYGQTAPRHKNESSFGCKAGQSCDCERPSGVNLPFFEYRKNHPHDLFYCGCWGWD